MMTRRYAQWGIWAVMAVSLLSQLTACGGSGGSFADGGIGGTGVVSAGVVTAKGSIFVNGIEYSVEGATFDRDGEIVTLSEDEIATRVGMIIELNGSLNTDGLTGQATDIIFEDMVEGTIESSSSNTPEVKVLTILAQQVVIEDGLTNFEAPLNFATIDSETDIIEVSGFRRADGTIQATFIEQKSAGQFEVVGSVIVSNPGNFMIGDLTVTDSSLASLQSGDVVKAEGFTYDQTTQTLDATSVNLQPSGLRISDADHAEVEGFVSGGPSTAAIPARTIFQVNGQDIQFTVNTDFSGGAATDVVNNIKVEVEGPLVDGILTADKIEFKDNLRLQSTVASKTVNSLTLIYPDDLAGTTTVDVTVDPVLTELETELINVNAGDSVRLEGRLLASGSGNTILATKLKRLSPDTKIILQAPLDSPNPTGGLITLLGVAIDTSGLSFSDEDKPVSEADFFAILQTSEDIEVKAKGDEINRWTELELER